MTSSIANQSLGIVFGPSPAMQRVLEQVHRAAEYPNHVVIGGEPGSGRRTMARAIHALSRHSGGFILVDGGSPTELETQLFGSPRGRRGDDVECISRKSALYLAQGGSLCLVKTDAVTPRLSARLARVVSDNRVALAGDGAILPLGVRFMVIIDSAANGTDEGFVETLLPDAEVIRIEMAPLRRRKQDIPSLALHLLDDACRRSKVAAKSFSGPASTLLSALPWRGNVPELKLLVDALAATTGEPVVKIEHVLDRLRLDTAVISFGSGGTLREARTRFERDFVNGVLDRHRGRVPDAAMALGIQRTNLYRKLRMLRVPTTGSPRENRRSIRSDTRTLEDT